VTRLKSKKTTAIPSKKIEKKTPKTSRIKERNPKRTQLKQVFLRGEGCLSRGQRLGVEGLDFAGGNERQRGKEEWRGGGGHEEYA